jgi:hypothetical protein
MPLKNSSDNMGNRIRDLPICSGVPKPLRHRAPPPPVNVNKVVIKQYMGARVGVYLIIKTEMYLLESVPLLICTQREFESVYCTRGRLFQFEVITGSKVLGKLRN